MPGTRLHIHHLLQFYSRGRSENLGAVFCHILFSCMIEFHHHCFLHLELAYWVHRICSLMVDILAECSAPFILKEPHHDVGHVVQLRRIPEPSSCVRTHQTVWVSQLLRLPPWDTLMCVAQVKRSARVSRWNSLKKCGWKSMESNSPVRQSYFLNRTYNSTLVWFSLPAI